MKIQCTSNLGKVLPLDCLKPQLGISEKKEFHLLIGKTYTVYAFTMLFGYVWYYVCDEAYSFYPVWNPAPLFTIRDPRLSSFWEFNCFIGSSAEDTQMIVAFPEWARDRLYYDRLTNGVAADVNTFDRYRKLIDAEHE